MFFFPHPIMAGHIVQHMAEGKARTVALLPDVKVNRPPLLQFATVRAIEVAPAAGDGCSPRH